MYERQKIANFGEWCKKCKYYKKAEEDDPCWDCLSDSVNWGTHNPTHYEEGKKE